MKVMIQAASCCVSFSSEHTLKFLLEEISNSLERFGIQFLFHNREFYITFPASCVILPADRPSSSGKYCGQTLPLPSELQVYLSRSQIFSTVNKGEKGIFSSNSSLIFCYVLNGVNHLREVSFCSLIKQNLDDCFDSMSHLRNLLTI